MGYFLLLLVSGLVKDIEIAVYLGLSSFLIGGSDSMMIYFCGIIYYWGLSYFLYLWETFHNWSLGQAGWSLILGWHQKA